MSRIKVLVVDDDPGIIRVVRAYLEKEGFVVEEASDGPGALKATRAFAPDLVILDIVMPGMDGIEVLGRLRQESDVFVLMLTVKGEEMDKVMGLSVGADDYLTKPFSPRELVARVKAILRRRRVQESTDPVLVFDRLRIDPRARRVWKDDNPIELTSLEFELLYGLARRPGWVMSREQLIDASWGYDYYGADRVVDVHIGHIRKKIEDDPANPQFVATVRGAGYRFDDKPAPGA